jgi:hypothetical protein
MAAAWTGVGVTKPAAANFPCKFWERGSSVNAFKCYLFSTGRDRPLQGTRCQSRTSVHSQDLFYAEGTEGVKGGESQISLKALKEPATHNRIKRETSIAQEMVPVSRYVKRLRYFSHLAPDLRAIGSSIRQLVIQHPRHLVDVGRHQVELRVKVEEARLFVL